MQNISKNWFVTVYGETKAKDMTQQNAIKVAISILKQDRRLSTLNVGIGKVQYTKGIRAYTLLPAHFYLD